MTKTHILKLPSGCTCSVKVNPSQLQNNRNPILRIFWSGKPKVADVSYYKEWIFGILRPIVDQHNKSICYVIQESADEWITYVIAPNKDPFPYSP